MALGRQWEIRLRMWKDNLEKRYIEPAFEVETEYFTTYAQLSLKDAKKGTFVKAPKGTKWGKKWEYGWFRTSFEIPEKYEGKRLCLHLGTAPEMLVYLNGVESGSIDKQHSFIMLDKEATCGTSYEVYAECYAGHGARREDAGPFGIDEITVPEDVGLQVVTESSYVAVWNEDIFQAYMDYLCLYELFGCLPETSLRRMKIIEGLKEFTYIADFELPHDQMVESIVKAREVLKPLLDCRNGSTAPDFTIFGQSHIDLAWLWHEDETKRKAARTYSNQLKLMEEYPDFKFLMCSPTVLNYNKKYYPELYKRIKAAAAEGRFIPEGAMWIESDTNIPSGESLIRQFVKGRRWFKNEMGVESVLAWMPDTFGYSGALPQIMKKCGVKYFATQKLLRADPETEQFPYNIFWWEGIDGTRILSHIYKKNNSQFTPSHLIERWEKDRNQQENIDSMLFPFGFGDGGGGCTRIMLEQARRCRDLEGAPRCTMESPVRFFERIDEKKVKNEYVGELYLAWHRGTLTSQSETKRGIRKAEVVLHNLEYFLSMAILKDYDQNEDAKTVMDEAKEKLAFLWDELLFCQFHDIAPGTSIERVHKEAVSKLDNVIAEGNKQIKTLIRAFESLDISENGTKKCDGDIYVYNTTSFDKNYFGYTIPAFGCGIVNKYNRKQSGFSDVTCREEKDCYVVHNDFYTCKVDNLGRIVSLLGTDGYEYVKSPWNEFLMYKDVNVDYDAWELGAMYENLPVELSEKADISFELQDGNCIISMTKMLNNSTLRQKLVFRPYSARIDFVTDIDWNERHKILKTAFTSTVYSKEAMEEIQFGYMKRPTHRSKQSDKDRYEVSNQKYTAMCDGGHLVAVMNDGKYGVNVSENSIRLTLLRAPLVPDMSADKGEHEFVYSVYTYAGNLTNSKLLSEAYDLNYLPVVSDETVMYNLSDEENGNTDVTDNSAENTAASGLFWVSHKNIVIETVKPSDKYEDGVILRIYEAMGMATVDTIISIPLSVPAAYETDMLEDNETELEIRNGRITLSFGSFEIKTVLLRK